jgi:hypothetical protein
MVQSQNYCVEANMRIVFILFTCKVDAVVFVIKATETAFQAQGTSFFAMIFLSIREVFCDT